MLILSCDFHPWFQQIAIFDDRTGEIEENRSQHRAEAERFYRSLAGQEVAVTRKLATRLYLMHARGRKIQPASSAAAEDPFAYFAARFGAKCQQ
ncbi:MAG TPA: hypothetical protein VKR60_10895 [Candidatus Sulfotelmatobacter sp.]|nr:hypothetical protein [Candidatus Sulfotelmatobacter sp.]